jgi:hypothetical protein
MASIHGFAYDSLVNRIRIVETGGFREDSSLNSVLMTPLCELVSSPSPVSPVHTIKYLEYAESASASSICV